MHDNLMTVLRLSTNSEGGYSNHPKDPGGPTNHGITQGTLSGYLHRPATISDVKALKLNTAALIYEKSYATPIWFDKLPSGLDYALFDYGINSGPSRAIKEIQGIVGVSTDGMMGMKTLAAILAQDAADLIIKLCDARLAFMKRLKTWGTFGRGWTYRVTGKDPLNKFARKPGVVGDALAMANGTKKPRGLISLFPLDQLDEIQDLMPLGKANEIQTKVLAPLRNKVIAGVATGTGLTTIIQAAETFVNPLQTFASTLQPYAETAKVIGLMVSAATVGAAVCVLFLNISKIRAPGSNS